jgi:DNA polymerase-3 subunit delta'
MSWKILGHDWAASMLAQHIATGQVRHAYLFTGPAGVGRRTLALQFVQALNCTKPPTPGEFCGSCRTCKQIKKMQQADLAVVQRTPERTRILIDQVRELQHTLMLKPYESKYRIGLLLNLDEASEEAQNALLKTLEEAPSQAVLLVTAESPESLLPTIVSRCEVLRLRPLPLDQLETALKDEDLFAPDEAHLLAHLSQGCPGTALRLHEHPELLEKRHVWMDDAVHMLYAPTRERFAYANTLHQQRHNKDREAILQIYLIWLSLWHDLLAATAKADTPIINLDFEKQIREMASHLDLDRSRHCAANLQQALDQMSSNPNPLLQMEVLLMDWPHI